VFAMDLRVSLPVSLYGANGLEFALSRAEVEALGSIVYRRTKSGTGTSGESAYIPLEISDMTSFKIAFASVAFPGVLFCTAALIA